MKTTLEKLMVEFEKVAHPAGGSFKASGTQRKRKAQKRIQGITPSPDGFNIRGGVSKKGINMRRTPAP